MLVKHPDFIKRIGWAGIPLIALCGLYVMAIPILEARYDIASIASTTFLGGGTFYMCLLAFKVFPFLNLEIKCNGNGFSIHKKNGDVKSYQWSEVGEIKHHASVQVLALKNKDGKTILAITEQAFNYYKFVELAIHKTGLKY